MADGRWGERSARLYCRLIGESSAIEQVALALDRERSAIDGFGDGEHAIEMIHFVLQQQNRV